MNVRIAVAALAATLAAGRAAAESISNDRLCQAIGDTPNGAVPPRDRAFFEDKCVCFVGMCAFVGSTRGSVLLATKKCTGQVRDRLRGREEDLPPMFIEKSCAKTQSPAKTYKLAKGELDTVDRNTAAERVERCIYTAKVTADPKTTIDYVSLCRQNPNGWEVLTDELREERRRIAGDAEALARKQAAQERVLAQDSAIFDAAFREASSDAAGRGFLTTCAEYLYDHSGPGTSQPDFLKFCGCAWEFRTEWNEASRERCRRAE